MRRKVPRRMLPASELPSFLRNLRTHKGEKTIQLALRLIVLTMVRTAELRGARWDEFDLEKKVSFFHDRAILKRDMLQISANA